MYVALFLFYFDMKKTDWTAYFASAITNLNIGINYQVLSKFKVILGPKNDLWVYFKSVAIVASFFKVWFDIKKS